MVRKMQTSELINIIASIVDIDELTIQIQNDNTIEITNKIDDQAIVVQHEKDGVWVRLRDPYTGYICETLDEFSSYVESLMKNEIEVCVGTKNNEWVETIILPAHIHDEMKEDVDYTISYWAYSKKNR